MRKTVLWLIMVTAASGPAGPAAAWNGNTHDELGRQTMLYLLRSNIPDLRLAGVVLAAAGEGMLSGAQPTRRWALAREAEDVDHYREVAIKNDGMTIDGIVPKIMYSFMGHNFAAFNHFILWGKQIPDAHDNQPGYTLEKDDSDDDLLEYLKQAGTDELDELCSEKATQLAQDWADDTWWVKPVNKVSFGLVGKALGWLAGQAASGRCPKLRVSYGDSPALQLYTNNSSTAKRSDFVKQLTPTRFHPVDNIGSAGLSLFLSSSHGQRAQLLSDVLYGGRIVGLDPKSGAYGPLHPVVAWHQACKASHDLATCARYIKVVGPDGLKNARCWSELTMAGGKTQSTAQIDIDQLVDRIVQGCKQGDSRLCKLILGGAGAKYCPSVVPAAGVMFEPPWNPYGKGVDSDKDHWESYLISATDASSETGIAGAVRQLKCKLPRGCTLDPTTGSSWTGKSGGLPRVPEACDSAGCRPYFERFWNYRATDWPEACVVPTSKCHARLERMLERAHDGKQGGLLLHLGRLLHAVADATQPGHVTGNLLGVEHVGLEEYTDSRITYDFRNYTDAEQQYPGHAVVKPSYFVEKTPEGADIAVHDLSSIFDLSTAATEIAKWGKDHLKTSIPSAPKAIEKDMEKIVERAAMETSDAVHDPKNKQAVFFSENKSLYDPAKLAQSAPGVSRAFLTRALVASTVALTRAMQVYYGAEWSKLAGKVSWTEADEKLVSGATRKTPMLELPVSALLAELHVPGKPARTFLTNVDNGYQEKTVHDLCLISTHNWCSTDPAFGRPCVYPDCKAVCPRGCSPGVVCQDHVEAKMLQPPSASMPFIEPPWKVRFDARNRGGPADLIHVSGAATLGKMDQIAHRGPLQGSAKQEVDLPAGTRSVAVWCTGPDIWNTQSSATGAAGGVTVVDNVVCKASIEAVYNSSQVCDRLERCLFRGGVVNKNGACMPWTGTPENAPDTQLGNPEQPDDTIAGGTDYLVNEASIRELARRYDASSSALTAALASAPSQRVTLVQPSPYGQASLMWHEAGRLVIVSITNEGDLVEWRGDPRAIQ